MRYIALIISRTYQRPRLGRVDVRVDAAAACSSICFTPLAIVSFVRAVPSRRAWATLPVYAGIGKRAGCRALVAIDPRIRGNPGPADWRARPRFLSAAPEWSSRT